MGRVGPWRSRRPTWKGVLMITMRARRPFAIAAVKSMLMIAIRARRPFAISEALLEEHADDHH